MTIAVKFHNTDYIDNPSNAKHLDLFAERVDQRITRMPIVRNVSYNTAVRGRDTGRMQSIFIVTAFISHPYDIDEDGTVEDVPTCKKYIENVAKTWWQDGSGNTKGRVYFEWGANQYQGFITKIDITEVAGNVNQYEVIIEFLEAIF